jgi:hypothetical protein
MRNSAEVSPGKRPIKLGAPAITTNVRSRRFVVRIRFGARRATADGDERVEIALNEPPSPTVTAETPHLWPDKSPPSEWPLTVRR